jgi:hypothetical protein
MQVNKLGNTVLHEICEHPYLTLQVLIGHRPRTDDLLTVYP